MGAMELRKFITQNIIKAIEEDPTLLKAKIIKLMPEMQAKEIASSIAIKEDIIRFYKDPPDKVLTVVRGKDIIIVNKELSVIHLNMQFDKGNWEKMDEMLEYYKRVTAHKIYGEYQYAGESCWNWNHILETKKVTTKDKVYQPGSIKISDDEKRLDLIARSANFAFNTILIALYERLISLYPDNLDLCYALCAIFESSCMFKRRINLLEKMFKHFDETTIAMDLAWSYQDDSDMENYMRIKKIIKSRPD